MEFRNPLLNQGTDSTSGKEALHHLKYECKHWFWNDKTFWHPQYEMMHFPQINEHAGTNCVQKLSQQGDFWSSLE